MFRISDQHDITTSGSVFVMTIFQRHLRKTLQKTIYAPQTRKSLYLHKNVFTFPMKHTIKLILTTFGKSSKNLKSRTKWLRT